MSFAADLERGQVGEILLRRWFDTMGVPTIQAVGANAAWDFIVRGAIEVKTDDAASRTGNAFLEVASHGRPSGICISQSSCYAVVVGQQAYLIGTDLLRSILTQLVERPGPDGKQGRLLPIRRLLAMPHVLVELGGLRE